MKVFRSHTLLGAICLIFIFASSCEEKQSSTKKTTLVIPKQQKILINPYSPWVDSVYAQLNWNQKIAQLIWVQPDWSQLDSLNNSFYQFGGCVLPDDSINFNNYRRHLSDSSFDVAQFNFMLKGAPSDDFLWRMQAAKPLMKGLNASDDTLFIRSFFSKTIEAFQKQQCHFILGKEDSSSMWNLSPKKREQWLKQIEENQLAYLTPSKGKMIKGLHLHCLINSDTVLKESDSVYAYYIDTNWTSFRDSLQKGKVNIHLSNNNQSLDSLSNLVTTLSTTLKETPELTLKIRKVLALKEFVFKKNHPFNSSISVEQHWNSIKTNFKGLAHQTHYSGNAVLSNDNTIPVIQIPKNKWSYISVSAKPMVEFTKGIRHYAEISEIKKPNLTFDLNSYKTQHPLIIVLNESSYSEAELTSFIKKVREFSKNHSVIVAGINLPFGENLLGELPNYIHCPIASNESQYFLAQSIMGGNPIKGLHPVEPIKATFHTEKIRLSYTIPEEVGISADSIKKIDKIAAEAIFSKATPGCQVFVAKEGKVIFNKGFGYHAYDYKTAVHTQDVYDIASVTKVAATTLCAMHFYDKGKYQLTDSLKSYLPDSLTHFLKHPSRLGSITFQELLTHKSGLPSGLPIHKFIAYVNKLIGRFDRYYCDASDHFFCVEVAKDFYLDSAYLDSLWVDMNRIWPGEKIFKYSDANMNTLYQVFRRMVKGKKTYDRYLDSLFYKPLNLKTTGFLPLKYLDTLKHRIAPTEYDTYWRYQVIKGHVHDPNAALYGGVAGNAGLFSSAHDLGILFQMLLNRGSYGGKKLIEPKTVDLFTSHYPGSHRGLGFDKPIATSGNIVAKDAPYTSYGHSGFTGICAWTDPENELVFVFTSNRVHPNPNNKKLIERGIRGRMHQVIYNQLFYNGSYKNSATKNMPYSKMAIDSTLLVTTP